MSQLKFCLITPSYQRDFARCRLLAESVDRFATSKIHHYIIVDRRDLKLFKQLESDRRTIITVESILPWWIYKIPLVKNGWFSWKTLPIRNWLIQQIVKLEIANHLKEDVLIFVDSDVVFIRSFSGEQFSQNNKVRLFRILDDSLSSVNNVELQSKWYHTANSVLGLPPFKEFDRHHPFFRYVGNCISWKRDNVLLLHDRIERITQKSWIEAIANSWHFSEYILYGIFVDRILQEKSGHYWDSQQIAYGYWGTKPLSKEQLQVFLQNMSPQHRAVMISAKSKMAVADYASLLDFDRFGDSISQNC